MGQIFCGGSGALGRGCDCCICTFTRTGSAERCRLASMSDGRNPSRELSPRSTVRVLLCAVALQASSACHALDSRVVGVSDGDTLTVLDGGKRQHKIRLSGIDAPESGQAFGNRSKQSLSDCAFGKSATVSGDKSDRYGRRVAKVTVAGIDCNLPQIELGMAWHYKKYASEQPAAEPRAYEAAEDVARSAKRGLWSDPHAMAPWEWRNGDGPGTQKGEAQRAHAAGECDCDAALICTGKRGSSYCITRAGSRRYFR